jgi:hypothetical protein
VLRLDGAGQVDASVEFQELARCEAGADVLRGQPGSEKLHSRDDPELPARKRGNHSICAVSEGFVGNNPMNPALAGIAPGARHVRFSGVPIRENGDARV